MGISQIYIHTYIHTNDMGTAATSDLLDGDVRLLGSTTNEFDSNIDSFSNVGTKSWSSKIVQLPHRYGPYDMYTSEAHRYQPHIDGTTLWSLGTSDARLVSSFMMESHDITTCFSGKQLYRASNPPALLSMTVRGDALTRYQSDDHACADGSPQLDDDGGSHGHERK